MNSSQATGRASKLPDYGLPGNDLNPNTPTPDQQKKVPFVIKVYGLLCMIDGIVTLPVVAIFLGMIAWAPRQFQLARTQRFPSSSSR